MRITTLATLALLLPAALIWAQTDDVIVHFPFDGDLTDAAGTVGAAEGPARFAEGRRGQSLDPQWKPLTVQSHPELNLAPGLVIDCWVYFDRPATGYQHIVLKDKEYQLRVDAESEGGRFAFFCYVNNSWESRVRTIAPEVGTWYHLVARWSGTEISLKTNGEKSVAPRTGVVLPTDNPVQLASTDYRIDDLIIRCGGAAQAALARRLSGETAEAERVTEDVFGAAEGWEGWTGGLGAEVSVTDGALHARLPSAAAVVINPRLQLDVSKRRYVSLYLACPGTQDAVLSFLTDAGSGSVSFPIWETARQSIVDLSGNPNWRGTLRSLSLSLTEGEPRRLALRNMWVSAEPRGKPYLYVRSVTPGRAALRAGREESIIAVVRSLGAPATGLRAMLALPEGMEVLGSPVIAVPDLAYDGTRNIEWKVRADGPVRGTARVTVGAEDAGAAAASCELNVTAPLGLPAADYVPEPQPVEPFVTTLMHYCPLWKFGTHRGWSAIEDWPERKPAIGWYDEGTEEVADWHIKYAVEHGIQGFIYCWYRANYGPDVKHGLGHAIEAMMRARYIDKFKFTIMWENGCALGVQSREDMMENLLPYWIENYFKHPSYLKIDGKPVLFVWVPGSIAGTVGGSDQVKAMFDDMRAACRKEGFEGLTIIGCVGSADRNLLERMAKEGWDASSAYGLIGPTDTPPGRDPDGAVTRPYAESVPNQLRIWEGKKEIGALPDIVDVMMGWDARPWHGPSSGYIAGANAESFRTALQSAKDLIERTPGNGLDKRLLVFDNWNEFGEGHYLEPTAGFGFQYLDAIREVLCPGAEPCVDITPEDVGLETPDRVYRASRGILSAAPKERKGEGSLLSHWTFDEGDEIVCLDSAPTGFHGFKHGFERAPGVAGDGFLCRGGAVSVGNDPLFFPDDGITVELWANPSKPDQSDQWFVNTVAGSDTGYRLGLGGGKVAWQVPVTDWSHMVGAPEPLPVGRWSHVVATYDNETMRIYVNGEEQASLPRPGRIRVSTGSLVLGSFQPGHARAYFEGVMDEVRLYDRALTAEQVRERHEESRR